MKTLRFIPRRFSFLLSSLACQLLLVLSSSVQGQDIWEVTVPFRGGLRQAELRTEGASIQVAVHATDKSGEVLWERTIASGNGFFLSDFAVDPAGNMFVCGYVLDSMTFGAGMNTIAVQNERFNEYAFFTLAVAKVAPDGSALWVNTAAWPNWEHYTEIEVDAGGNAYVMWSYETVADLPPVCTLRIGSEELPLDVPATSTATVLARFSQKGDLDWLRQYEHCGGGELRLEKKSIAFFVPNWRTRVEYDLKGRLISAEEIPW